MGNWAFLPEIPDFNGGHGGSEMLAAGKERGPEAHLTASVRLFLWAERVRDAWRPAATRTGVRESVAAARQPTRIDGVTAAYFSENT